jgi:hypothetical protein
MTIITFPSSPTLYQTFTVGSKIWIWNGYAWDIQNYNVSPIFAQANAAFTQANSAFNKANTAGGVKYTASNTVPASANTGDQWYYISSDILYEYVTDGTNNVWVDTSSSAIAANAGSASSNTYTSQYLLYGTTTGNTQTEIFINGVANSRISISPNVAGYYTADIVARRTDTTGENAAFMLKAAAANTSGTVADVGTVYEIVVARSDANYNADIQANNTYKSINIYVTGDTGRTVNWKAVVTVLEV